MNEFDLSASCTSEILGCTRHRSAYDRADPNLPDRVSTSQRYRR